MTPKKIYLSKLVMTGAESLDKPISDSDVEYIRTDILRAEIERRITDNTFGAKLELIDILAWLDTLESEKPMNQDGLEEEFNHYCFDFKDPDTGEDIPKNQISFSVEDALNVARHFAQWGAEHLKK